MRAAHGPPKSIFLTTIESCPSPAGFRQFNLQPAIERGVAEAGFTEPRPIQVLTIPAALAGRDVLGLAQTGTGKTAAFALPILERLSSERRAGPRALVLAPTRELATQIHAEFQTLARFTQVRAVTIFGGVSARGQIAALRKRPDVIIACPGRLLDLHQQRAVDLSGIRTLVLDEADHMFDIGFLPTIRKIIAALPATRQNLMFSATMPSEVRALADGILRDPQTAELAHSKPAETIDHAIYPVSTTRKVELLGRLLKDEALTSAIVFSRTKKRAQRLAETLGRMGHSAVALQGNMSQGQRDRAMNGFRAGRFDVLVATDIAARGIDVAHVSHVINFDVPNTPEAYTHRIGRTGRAERSGQAYTFVTDEDVGMVRAIERALGKPITRRHLAGFEITRAQRPSDPSPASRRNQRSSRHRSGSQHR